jgi:hypothetical protein
MYQIWAFTVSLFLLGILLYQMKRLAWFLKVMAILAIPFLAALIPLHLVAINMRIPHDSIIAACTNKITIAHFKTPPGRRFVLEVQPANNISGSVHISDGKSGNRDFAIDSEKFMEQISFFQPKSDYDVTVTLDRDPPSNTLLRLHFEQSHRDLTR